MLDAFDEVPCAVLRVRDNGIIKSANAAFRALMGRGPDTLIGHHVDAVLGSGARIFYQMYLFPMLRVQGHADEIYLALRDASGKDVHVLLSATRDDDGLSTWAILPMAMRSQLEDELLRARKAAEQADQAKLRFLSMVSHDLRTPLSAIDLAATLMARGLRGPVTDAQREDLARIQDAAQYVIGLVSEMLDFARSQAGRMRVDVAPMALMPVVEQAGALVQPQVKAKALTYTCEAEDLWGMSDAKKLKQVLVNLLSNAVKFTPEGGHVRLTCTATGDGPAITVADTGRGIPAEQLDRIFDPFMQVAPGSSFAEQGGVGLGLAISRELVHAMGGTLEVESTEGEGTAFTVTLKPAEPEATR